MKMSFKDCLKYRQAWLGVAMLWIIFFHSPLELPSSLLQFVKGIGYGGVDICLFASGIGCYYSLNSNADIGSFIKRRFYRIYPTYLVFILLWLVYKSLLHDFTWQMAIGNILGIQNLTGLGQDFNWYISALFIGYILAPSLKIIVDRFSPSGLVLVFVILLLISVAFWDANTYIITVTRLPIFLLGMVFAQATFHHTQISKQIIVIMGVLCFFSLFILFALFQTLPHLLWSHGLYWYPFVLITPFLCVSISFLSQLCNNHNFSLIPCTLELIGNYSFELYLLHIPLFQVLPYIISRLGLQNSSWLVWTLGTISLIIGCRILRSISQHFAPLLRKILLPFRQPISKTNEDAL